MHVGCPINFPRSHIPACFGTFPRLSGVNCPSCSRSPVLALSAGSLCRGTAPANSSSSGTKLRPSPEARSEASTGTPDVPCTCRPAAATSFMHRNSSRMQQKSSQNLQQPRAIEINCAAMTWSERSELRVSAGAYTASVRIQTIHRA